MRTVSHVFKRLGIGPHPDRVAASTSAFDAIGSILDATNAPIPVVDVDEPEDAEELRDLSAMAPVIAWWLEQMAFSPDPLTERMTWFWHDHFATSLRKVRAPYLMWRQHRTVRSLALQPFSDLLFAVAKDPAMLIYLDGARNTASEVNENFAREVMELHTLGSDHYTQSDVTEAARAATGWLFHHPFLPQVAAWSGETPEWEPIFIPRRHAQGLKTILGVTAHHDLDSFLELLVEHPGTADRIAGTVFHSLVGREPDPAELKSLTKRWGTTDPTLHLIEAIVELPAFLDPTNIDTRIKTPVERLVGVVQAYGSEIPAEASYALHTQAYLPFNPPSPAGFPSGDMLLGPHQLVHAFDFLNVIGPHADVGTDEILGRLGLHSVSDRTRETLDRSTPDQRIALATNSPEYALT